MTVLDAAKRAKLAEYRKQKDACFMEAIWQSVLVLGAACGGVHLGQKLLSSVLPYGPMKHVMVTVLVGAGASTYVSAKESAKCIHKWNRHMDRLYVPVGKYTGTTHTENSNLICLN
ncbi:uncharacterized protein LOC127700089 [Mytilus californianus]|uniref:uncharacterized protein LOC127700089 n=1 Tax=Mytilus californianus TaxID=6549 RepID=UPI002247FEB6|nr:uncharacterized protein LOC127700089 [Mytilus californianus]